MTLQHHTLSENGRRLLKQFEGVRLYAYLCTSEIWTIGYGHTRNVKPNQTITKEQAELLLNEDLAPIIDALQGYELNQNQFDALVSLIFNIGLNGWKSSKLRKAIINNEQQAQITYLWKQWRWSGKEPKLLKRRETELNLYFS